MFGTVIHQQLLLIRYTHDGQSEWQEWPLMSGQSADESRRVFDIMQDLDWVVGFPSNGWITFKLTNPGEANLATLMHGGVGAVQVNLTDEQLAIVSNIGGNSVFIVHSDGSDASGLSKDVQAFINGYTRRMAIMLDPTPGQNLWDEFERRASECGAAVCVWSPDRDNPESPHIRPNVLLETGYFMARLGKGKVIVIKEDDKLHSPSDLAGIVWATKDNWRERLPDALDKAMGSTAQR